MALGLGLGLSRSGFVGGFDADYQAVLNRGTTLGYSLPTGTALSSGDTLVRDLKSAGVWDKLDLFYVFATNGDSDFATLNWKTPASFQATKVNAPTFTSLEGFTGDGATSYLNTNWNPTDNGLNYVQNSASFGFYARQICSASDARIGSRVAFNNKMSYDFGTVSFQINQNTQDSFAGNNSSGLRHINRSGSASAQRYINGSINGTTSTLSSSPNNFDFYLLAINSGGSALLFSNNQLSIAFAGADLSAEASDFFTAIETYMDAIGKGVVA